MILGHVPFITKCELLLINQSSTYQSIEKFRTNRSAYCITGKKDFGSVTCDHLNII